MIWVLYFLVSVEGEVAMGAIELPSQEICAAVGAELAERPDILRVTCNPEMKA